MQIRNIYNCRKRDWRYLHDVLVPFNHGLFTFHVVNLLQVACQVQNRSLLEKGHQEDQHSREQTHGQFRHDQAGSEPVRLHADGQGGPRLRR